MSPQARRRTGGVFNRPSSGYPSARFVNDGGHDAPLNSRWRLVYRATMVGIVVVGFALILLFR